jgi:hypothetical protein
MLQYIDKQIDEDDAIKNEDVAFYVKMMHSKI